VGSARFRLSPSTRFALLPRTPYQSLCALLSSALASFKKTASPRWQWLVAVGSFPSRRSSGHTKKLAGAAESGKRNPPVDK
jgi:hypothetical protein